MPEPLVVGVFGPTALGKTDVAILLAERLGAEIVVADSMQVYAGLPLITNQPDPAQRARVRHHLVGYVPPQREYTVAEYAREAHQAIDMLLASGRPVVVEGGSGLYLRAALGDLDFLAAGDPEVRAELEARWAASPEAVVAELRRLHPAVAERIDTANPRRVLRALEALYAEGRTTRNTARDLLWKPAERYAHRLVALDPGVERAALVERIEARVDEMLHQGALQEVEAVLRDGPLSRTALQAIGAKELSAVLAGTLSLEQAAAAMKSRTRALVRRQLTWLRKLPAATRVVVSAEAERTAAEVLELVRERP